MITSEEIKSWVQAYILFGRIDRNSGNIIVQLIEELEGVSQNA